VLTKPKPRSVLFAALLAFTALASASAAASEMIPRNDVERKRALTALSVVWAPNEIYFDRAAAAFDLPAKTTIALGRIGRLPLLLNADRPSTPASALSASGMRDNAHLLVTL
jgi:hypothetical protein